MLHFRRGGFHCLANMGESVVRLADPGPVLLASSYYGLDGQVLLLGTEKNTSLHLAEARTGQRPVVQVGAPS